MPESNSALDLLRAALKGETNPHLQLILLEQGMIFCNLPPDLEALRSELSERLAPFPIPPVVDVILATEAETVLFNEYVDDPSREPFKEAMREAGFLHQAVSETSARHNQIFAASKHAFQVGDLRPPQFDGSAISNYLHLKFADFPFEMVGLRAPAYEKAADRKAYWAELGQIMESAKCRAILFAGDINFDPFVKSKQEGATQVPFPFASGYRVPNPMGDWSYLAHSGKGYKIDHVIHTPSVVVTDVECLARIGDRFLAGEKSKAPISDHAALRFTAGARTD